MDIQVSKYWFLTSPHLKDQSKTIYPLTYTFEQASAPVQCYVDQVMNVIKSFDEKNSAPVSQSRFSTPAGSVYDYVIGVEDGNHVHAFLEFSSPTSLYGYRNDLPEWNIKIVADTDLDVEQAKTYAKKGGYWIQKHPDIPSKYASESPKWRPWQLKAIDHLNNQNDRQILYVYDPTGNTGKTFLALWFSSRCRARYLPAVLREAQDFLHAAFARECGCYFVDFPKSPTEASIPRVFSAIESIKNGHVYDERYNYRERYMDPPKVCVFGNFKLDKSLLSKDRWDVIQAW